MIRNTARERNEDREINKLTGKARKKAEQFQRDAAAMVQKQNRKLPSQDFYREGETP